MNNYYLVRHGNKVKLAGDPGLSEVGIKQAQLTGEFFKYKNVTAIFASPFKRTTETAQYIAAAINIEKEKIQIDERLKERLNWGDIPGQPFDEFLAIWNKTSNDRDFTPPIGSSSRDAGNRMQSVLDEYKDKDDQNIVIVTHGGVIVDLVRNLFSDAYITSLKEDFLGHGIQESAITHISYTNGAYSLDIFDWTEYLSQVTNK